MDKVAFTFVVLSFSAWPINPIKQSLKIQYDTSQYYYFFFFGIFVEMYLFIYLFQLNIAKVHTDKNHVTINFEHNNTTVISVYESSSSMHGFKAWMGSGILGDSLMVLVVGSYRVMIQQKNLHLKTI